MWIETKNKLPEFNKWVLCYCRIYGYYIGSYKQIDDTNWGNWHDGKELGVLPPVLWQYMEEIPLGYSHIPSSAPRDNIHVRPAHAPKLEQVEEYFIRNGSTKETALKFFHNYESLDWKSGITPIVNWWNKAYMWICNNKEDNPAYWEVLKSEWVSFYKQHFQIEPTINNDTERSLKSIISNLKSRCESAKKVWDEHSSKETLHAFLTYAYSEDWLKNNFLLPNIERQFDKIVSNATTKKGSTTGGFNAAYKDELARRMANNSSKGG